MNTAKHDPQNPDNCPPRCKECRRATLDEKRGVRRRVARTYPATKPSWWTCELTCGHVVDVQRSGQYAPSTAYCSVPTCGKTLLEALR